MRGRRQICVSASDLIAFCNDCNILRRQNATGDTQSLVTRGKQCLGALQATDQVIPRQEIIEYCTVFLLNMAEWDYLTSLEKRWSYTEFAAAISSVCQDIIKYKGGRKFPREAWDMSWFYTRYLSRHSKFSWNSVSPIALRFVYSFSCVRAK